MSIEQIVKVWACDVPPAQQSILLVLANRATEDGRKVYPSVARIVWASGLSRRTVQRELGKLVELKALEVVFKGGGRSATEYALCLDQLPQKKPFKPDPRHGDAGTTETASKHQRHGDAGHGETGATTTPVGRQHDTPAAPQLWRPSSATAMAPHSSYRRPISGEAAGRATPAGAPAAKTKRERELQWEADQLTELMQRRAKIGIGDFRDPIPGETEVQYRAAQEAECNKRMPREPRFPDAKPAT